jgi:hypothetical protein
MLQAILDRDAETVMVIEDDALNPDMSWQEAEGLLLPPNSEPDRWVAVATDHRRSRDAL